MSTFSVMKTRIADEMKFGELSAGATAVASSIVSAIEFFKRRRFYFNEFNDEVATASSSTTYLPLSSFAVKVLVVDSVKAVIGTRDYPLSRKTWDQLDAIDSGQFYGYPDWYAIHADKLRFYPPPNGDYAIRLSGVKDLPEVSISATANATNAWMTDAEELIRMKAKADLFRDELRSFDLYNGFASEAHRVYMELMRETRAKVSSGRIRPTMW